MIYISYIETPFGIIEIRATSRKLLSVLFVQEIKINVTENEITRKVSRELLEYFEGTRKKFDIVIELGGTDFEKLVFSEVLKIPYGSISTYKKIAENIGKESSVRAVGNIIGKNTILVIIPCHRVIGSNGKMRGYVAGIDKKQALLNFEKENEEKD